MTETKPKRRWFVPQFGLRSLFVAMAVLAIAFAWYAERVRLLKAEKQRLGGKWRFENADWNNRSKGRDVLEFKPRTLDSITIPSNGVGQIDFYPQQGVSLAIYRFVEDRIEVAQNFPGQPRPTEFDRAKCYSLWFAKRIASTEPKP